MLPTDTMTVGQPTDAYGGRASRSLPGSARRPRRQAEIERGKARPRGRATSSTGCGREEVAGEPECRPDGLQAEGTLVHGNSCTTTTDTIRHATDRSVRLRCRS